MNNFIRSLAGRLDLLNLFRREDVEVHALSEGILAAHLVELALGVQSEVVAQVLPGDLAVALVDRQVPVRVGSVVAGGDALPELGEPDVAAGLLHAPAD
jgi:hypothetical protein